MSRQVFEAMSLDDLGSLVSDWYKDTHGMRPRGEGLYADKARLVEYAMGLESYHESMHQTFEGREQLREEGWHIAEWEPDLIIRARWLKEERDRARAEREAEYESKWDY